MPVDQPLLGLSMRIPPANVQAEQSLLGAILANNKAFDRVGHFLRPEHFADPFHGRLFGEISRLILEGKVADPITLRPWFQAQPDWDEMPGGAAYMAQLLSAMVGIINAADYGRSIQDSWAKRQIIDRAELMVEMAFSENMRAEDIVNTTVTALESTMLLHGDVVEVSLQAASELVFNTMSDAMGGKTSPIFSTGIADLDAILGGGLKLRHLNILGGRPGHGKSALARQVLLFIAQEYKMPVHVISLEMTAEDQAACALGTYAGISADRIEQGRLSTAEAMRVFDAKKGFADLRVFFDDRPRLNLDQIRMGIRQFRRKYVKKNEPFLVVIDHMHLISLNSRTVKGGLGLVFAIGENANGLKELAKDENCSVLALAQLSRNKEGSEDKVPTLGDLKNSGDIEAAADKVFFTHRPELHLHKSKPSRKPNESDSEYAAREIAYQALVEQEAGVVHLVSAKVRQGRTGAIQMRFDGETTAFLSLHQ
jgi:replicative DNA helicase